MSAFAALGFDPAPGDVAAVRSFAEQLETGRRSADDALDLMRGGDSAEWQGMTADAFRSSLDSEFRPHLLDIRTAFEDSRGSLTEWADRLADFQARAARLEEQARVAQATLASRQSSLATTTSQYRADPLAEGAGDDLALALRLAESAQGDLDGIRRRARTLQSEVEGCATVCAQALQGSSEIISKYSGSNWDKFKDFVSGVGDSIADAADWFMDNVMPILEDIIDTIGPIMAVVALFAAFIPGVGQAIGAIALGLAIASVAIDGLQALRGEEGAAGDFVMGLAGLALGGALGKLGTALGNGTRQVLIPVIQGGGGLALAGGGSAAAAGSLTLALRFNPIALQANTLWMSTKLTEAHMSGTDMVGAMTQPAVNLGERVRNLASGDGPRTDAELAERGRD
ncbi:putative T7SS-secreted protein [Microbacterium sp. zg.Y909]|uniref:putative T7SS-secreted protein n=1 Tax=Microbacterium sp. zg.Y909 TaxID=2969413 RepID=UPI00214CE366|nr:hypothetical protein [Microbacterium sp. zg.Y909]MCR2825042.1 hypothetical protein [Microbacterium sp. zg.Y909]